MVMVMMVMVMMTVMIVNASGVQVLTQPLDPLHGRSGHPKVTSTPHCCIDLLELLCERLLLEA